MTKFNMEEKIDAVLCYQKGFVGIKSLAKSIGVNHPVLQNWIKQYEYHGEKAFNKSYKSYTTQFKLDVLNYIKETGTSIRETAAIFNITAHSTIQKWQKGFELRGIDALISKQKERPSVKKETNKGQDLRKHYEPKMSNYVWRMLT